MRIISYNICETYDANGVLLRRVTTTPSRLPGLPGNIGLGHTITTTEDRIGLYTYTGNTLSRIDTPMGYVDGNDSIRYYITDYQGNIRQVVNPDGEVLQDNHYYPFGMLMGESSDIVAANLPLGHFTDGGGNRFRYGAKELITTGGVNLSDYTARFLDHATLRFLTPDPLREKYTSTSSYLYCGANPVMFIDPTGMDSIYCEKKGEPVFLCENGQNTGEKYIVKGKTKKRIEKELKKEDPNTENMEVDPESDDVLVIPPRYVFDAVDKDIEKSEESGVEQGSHIKRGETEPVNWDPGTKPIQDGNKKQQSIAPFKKNGKNIGGNPADIAYYWHIHPATSNGLGYARVSENDIKCDINIRKGPYTGYTFVVGLRDGKIVFYNQSKTLFKLNYKQLKELSR